MGYFIEGLGNDKTTFVGPRSLFMAKESLYLLMFEKVPLKKKTRKILVSHLTDDYQTNSFE